MIRTYSDKPAKVRSIKHLISIFNALIFFKLHDINVLNKTGCQCPTKISHFLYYVPDDIVLCAAVTRTANDAHAHSKAVTKTKAN